MIHLHGHSTFSFLDGYGTPDQIARRMVELGHTACAITDHGNVFAHVHWQQAGKKHGVKPIYGCEFYIVDNMRDRTKGAESVGASGFPHITVLAKNQTGYRNLLLLSKLSYVEGFYYKPRIDWDALARYQEGLIVLSGCVGGYPSRLILNQGPDAAYSFLETQRQRIENLYVELIPQPGLDLSHATFGHLMQIAVSLGLPAVITADAHFPRREDHYVEDIMLAVGVGDRVDAAVRKLQLPEYQFYCTEAELRQRAKDVTWWATDEWLDYLITNTRAIADQCEVEIPRAKPVVFPGLNPGETADQRLWKLVLEGAIERGVSLSDQYHERAVREFQIICEKGFSDYILAITDVVRYMKSQDTLVMLRGSAGGCLLLWLLGASETDPIRHELSFERFFDHTREDPPDVDVDFEQGKRQLAIEYIYQKYGPENCSQIAALSRIKAKAALQDAAKAFGIHRSQFEPLAKALDSMDDDVDRQLHEITDPAALDVLRRYPHLRIIEKMVGQYRQSSIHAAGVLVSSQPLTDVIGVVLGADKQPVAAIDKKGCSALGFLKMDFLSVSSLDVVANAVRKLGKPMTWLYSLPLDDPAALEVANRGMLAGVFQLDGASAARVSRQIGLNTFDDVVAASALCRPGPGDWVSLYTTNKYDTQKLQQYLATLHPVAAAAVSKTYGILLYQEQVMRLARELAGLDWPYVHKLRKGVQDKLGLDPNTGPAWKQEWEERFVGGCLAQGVHRQEADFWWNSVQSHGAYSFNRSHCVTYGIIGYWMLYLKAHHPAAFYEAYLQLEEDPIKSKRLIFEFRTLGGVVHLIHPSCISRTFTSPEPGVLVGGLENIKGIGPAISEAVIKAQPRTWQDLYTAMGKAAGLRLQKTGVETGEWDIQQLITLAPWFPVPATAVTEAAIRNEFGLADLSIFKHGEQLNSDAVVAGYITATDFNHNKIIFILEDEHRAITVRVANRLLGELSPKFKQLMSSDYVAISGWWAGDTLFAKDMVLLKRKADAKTRKSA